MTVTPLPLDARTVLCRWLKQRGYRHAARALHRNQFLEVLARIPPRERGRVRPLIDAVLDQRRRRREVRAEERSLWLDDPVLQEAREFYLLGRRRRLRALEAQGFLRTAYTAAALELLQRRNAHPTLESLRAAVREVRQAMRALSTLRVLPGGRS